MKRLIFLFVILCLANTAFAQLEVRPGSFHKVDGFVNINMDKQTDDNDQPYAVLKVRTENIDGKQRRDLNFKGDARTFFEIEYKDGEVWLYISYYASYIKISHDDMSSTEFYFPFDMEPKCGYELTLVNKAVPINNGWGSLTVNTKPENDAKILLNGRDFDATTPYSNNMIPSGKYEITVSKDRYKTVTKIVDVADGDKKTVEIEMPLDVAVITLTADAQTSVYVDREYKKSGTWSGELKSGNYEIVYKKQYYQDAKQIITVEGGEPKTYEIKLLPINGELHVNSEPSNASIFIDGKNYGVTPAKITDIIIGPHELRLEKDSFGIVMKQFVLEEGKLLTINETLPTGREISISTDKNGDMIYIDGNYVGTSPLTTSLSFGEYNVKAIREGKEITKKITVVQTDGDTSVQLAFATGAINGVFSVSSRKKVQFSKGNLQYQASTKTWRFAENQWDVIGSENSKISENYSGWIDLFGWGTSSYNGKNPWMTSTTNTDYGNGERNIARTNYDWGVNNIISNVGGNSWRTLTSDEWMYVFDKRSTNSGIRYAKAQVNGVNGVILLPDNWRISNYSLSNTNKSYASFSSNRISQSDWQNNFETNGAVFLPAASYRLGSDVNHVGSLGGYWSASHGGSYSARSVWFGDGHLDPDYWHFRYHGFSVRLVCSAEN